MTRDQITARIAELEAANETATSWGAATGARFEEIQDLKRALRRIERANKTKGDRRMTREVAK